MMTNHEKWEYERNIDEIISDIKEGNMNTYENETFDDFRGYGRGYGRRFANGRGFGRGFGRGLGRGYGRRFANAGGFGRGFGRFGWRED